MRCVSLRDFLEACFSLGDEFTIVSVFSAELGSTANTCGASVYEAFWKNFTRFLREGVQFLIWFCRARCCARHVPDGPDNAELQVQFLRGCGRRCVHAATSSRQSGTRFRSVHRQVRDGLIWLFCLIFRHFSPLVQLDVRARVAGRRELAPRRSATPIRLHS